MDHDLILEIYQDVKGEWRWRMKAKNGEILASGEGYKRFGDMDKTLAKLWPHREHFIIKKAKK